MIQFHMSWNEFRASPLSSLENRELTGVTFVMDYLQPQFNGPILSVFVWPIVSFPEQKLSLRSSGYRDALCNQIGKIVVAAVEEPKTKLAIHFADDATFEISLKDEDQIGPEAAMLDDGTGKRCVW